MLDRRTMAFGIESAWLRHISRRSDAMEHRCVIVGIDNVNVQIKQVDHVWYDHKKIKQYK